MSLFSTDEVEVLGRSFIQAAEVFGQKIKEGMIAMAQIKEGYYEQILQVQEDKQCETCLTVGKVTKVNHKWLCAKCMP